MHVIDHCVWIQLHCEYKSGSDVLLRFERDLTAKLFHYFVSNHQPEANSLRVFLLGISVEAKQLEEFALILLGNPHTSVHHRDLNELVIVYLNYLDLVCYAANRSELESIRLQDQ